MYKFAYLLKKERNHPLVWGRKFSYISSEWITGIGLVLTLTLLFISYLAFIRPMDPVIKDYSFEKQALFDERSQLVSVQNEKITRLSLHSELPQALDFIRRCFENKGIVVSEIAVNHFSEITNSEYRQSLIKINAVGQRNEMIESLEEIQKFKGYVFLFQDMDLTTVDITNIRVHTTFMLTTL